jgi:N-acetylglucosaminyl-diphospho-decaprenol L-rhamnosyltransferase
LAPNLSGFDKRLMPSLAIVIVNWNAGKQLQRCISSIVAAQRESFRIDRVIVVDNASSDGSSERLRSAGLPLVVIANPANRGFAVACNQGAGGSTADYLLFLNPDVVLEPCALEESVAFMQKPENARVGICGIQLFNSTGEIARSCARIPRAAHFFAMATGLERIAPSRFPGALMEEWDHQMSRTVEHVIGAFFLVRRSLFASLGGFDERFFVYLEDIDFSCRALQSGWTSYYLATVRAQHNGGGCSEQVRATRLFYSLRSRILYAYKHLSVISATAVLLLTIFVEPVVRLGRALFRGSFAELAEVSDGYWKLWKCAAQGMRQS